MSKKKIILIAITGMIIIAIAIAAYLRWQLKQGSRTPPPAGVSVLTESVALASELPKGFIVWSSNRSGNHDIVKMKLPQREITSLTNHPNAEYFPRISPDGRYVVFARAQKRWVSHRKMAPWDIILLDLESGEERLLAKNGNTPTWSADGSKVYYQRKVTAFAEVDIKTGKEKILFASGNGDVKKSVALQTPGYSTKANKMTVTLRHGQHMIALLDLNGKLQQISDGCQLTWSKNSDFLYYVDHGGKMKNAFYLYDPKTDLRH